MSFWSAPPRTPPPSLETHFLELLREVWRGGGGIGIGIGSKIMNLLVFFDFELTNVSESRLHGVWQRGTSAYVVYALFSHFCYVGGFGDLRDPVLPTLRGASGDVVTVYAH